MTSHGYNKTTFDNRVYTKKYFDDHDFIILPLFLDDMSIIVHDPSNIRLKRVISKYFAMKALRPTKKVLGMKISRDKKNEKLWLSQKSYIDKVNWKIQYL